MAVWLTRSGLRKWKFSWTLFLAILITVMFATAVSMAGFIHQIGWIARTNLLETNKEHFRAMIRSNEERLEQQCLTDLIVEPKASNETVSAVWASLRNSQFKFHTPRALWLIRNEDEEITAFLLVPESWDETMERGFFLSRRAGKTPEAGQERPGAEILRWVEGRYVIQ